MADPEQQASPDQSGESSTDYSGMIVEAKADLRPGEEGYVEDPQKAFYMAHAADAGETAVKRYEEQAREFRRRSDELNQQSDGIERTTADASNRKHELADMASNAQSYSRDSDRNAQEARANIAAAHEEVARVYDAGQAEDLDDLDKMVKDNTRQQRMRNGSRSDTA